MPRHLNPLGGVGGDLLLPPAVKPMLAPPLGRRHKIRNGIFLCEGLGLSFVWAKFEIVAMSSWLSMIQFSQGIQSCSQNRPVTRGFPFIIIKCVITRLHCMGPLYGCRQNFRKYLLEHVLD